MTEVNMKEKITKKQHYIPQFYLKNFAGNDGKLWVYDRIEKKYFKSDPKDICCEKYLYEMPWENANPKLGKYILPNQIEDDFAKKESEYSKLLEKITKICSYSQNKRALVCHKDEKRLLASFVANIFLRNPWSLERANINSVPDELMKNKEIQSIDELLKTMNFGGIESLVKAVNKKIWLDEEFIGNVPKQRINDVLDLNFSILVSKKQQFITSSFPVVYTTYDSQDEKTHFNSLFLPIHSYIGLIYTHCAISKYFQNRMIVIESNVVNQINQWYLQENIEQTRFLIGQEEKSLKYVVKN